MNICVFSSSSNALADIYFEQAQRLAILMAQHEHRLVYGGANVGLMDRMASTLKANGGTTIGIIPRKIYERELAASYVDELIVTETMNERKQLMRDRSDAFVALPGGFGTLEETIEVLTLKQLDYHRKPIVLVNVNGFFNNLLAQFEESYQQQFARENYRKMYAVVDDVEAAIRYIEDYSYEDLGDKWFNVPTK